MMFSHKMSFRKWYLDVLCVEMNCCIWFCWKITSFVITDNLWAYSGFEILYEDHDNKNDGKLLMVLCAMALMAMTFVIYWTCYLLHYRCSMCEHSYSRYFRPRALAVKMTQKEKELEDMPDRDDAFESGIAL